jgi:hypothetical protein
MPGEARSHDRPGQHSAGHREEQQRLPKRAISRDEDAADGGGQHHGDTVVSRRDQRDGKRQHHDVDDPGPGEIARPGDNSRTQQQASRHLDVVADLNAKRPHERAGAHEANCERARSAPGQTGRGPIANRKSER